MRKLLLLPVVAIAGFGATYLSAAPPPNFCSKHPNSPKCRVTTGTTTTPTTTTTVPTTTTTPTVPNGTANIWVAP